MLYAASLLIEGRHTPPKSNEIWEEIIVIIDAISEDEARRKAEIIGKSKNLSYQTEAGLLFWEFRSIERVFLVGSDTISDGTEVFSRFLRDTEAKSLLTPFDEG